MGDRPREPSAGRHADPKVSVAVIAYNHERFIAQALASILAQRVNFNYEIVVGEDCSTDRTRQIVAGLQRRHPGRIRLLPGDRNLGQIPNLARTLAACRGEYVALLEGDDYWLSPQKLQTQIDLLDRHAEIVLSCHNGFLWLEDEGRFLAHRHVGPAQKAILTLADVLVAGDIPTPSMVFRRSALGEFPEWLYTLNMADWPLLVLLAQRGDVSYIDECWCVYRIHRGGLWSSRSIMSRLQSAIKMYECVNAHLGRQYGRKHERIIRARLAQLYHRSVVESWRIGEAATARRHALACLRANCFSGEISARTLVGMLVMAYAPGFYRLTVKIRRSWPRAAGVRAARGRRSASGAGDRTAWRRRDAPASITPSSPPATAPRPLTGARSPTVRCAVVEAVPAEFTRHQAAAGAPAPRATASPCQAVPDRAGLVRPRLEPSVWRGEAAVHDDYPS